MKFFGAKEFFTYFLISKIAVKMSLTIITKNHAADSEIGFLAKSISKSNGSATAMPTAWEFISIFSNLKTLLVFSYTLKSFKNILEHLIRQLIYIQKYPKFF